MVAVCNVTYCTVVSYTTLNKSQDILNQKNLEYYSEYNWTLIGNQIPVHSTDMPVPIPAN